MSARIATSAVVAAAAAVALASFQDGTRWQVAYSPHGGCTELAVAAIGGAKCTILVQGYGFSSAPIAAALISAHKRGVRVELLLDQSNRTQKASEAGACAIAGIPVWIDAAHPIAHNKILMIDGHTVLTGSFNWTGQAEANAENLLLIVNAALAKRYADNWEHHKAHAKPWSEPGP